MYLYKTVTYHDTTDVVTVPANNSTNNSDFVANNKSSAIKVDELNVSETTFVTELSYEDFDSLVEGNTTWASVKYIAGPRAYQLYLVSTNPLS